MLQLDEKDSGIALPHPEAVVYDLKRDALRRTPGRRTTDALRFRNRELRPEGGSGQIELLAGLSAPQAWIPSKYFYDLLGSQLFDAITKLPEYYPTRTEAAIFNMHSEDIARVIGSGRTFVDLGAGNCEKAARLFASLKPADYVAVDISTEYLESALAHLRHRFPEIRMSGIGMDMTDAFELPESVPYDRRLFFYPGSSIGNFTPMDAAAFLADLHRQCGSDGGLLIGVDLIKEKAILDAAYDDALGVTAAFNLNALNNVNAVLGSNFDVRDWRHCGFFNEGMSRAEMHVETRLEVEVRWPGGSRRFEAGERIHTENSYKYNLDEFGSLLRRTGFRNVTAWTDQRNWFALFYACA
ncbi:MAG TPA: L-histidine N(alpha)-methyltransferase [Burkholderiales bacterium]|nr:L-histidine N(alpha)-methyltransferase [Burkholderiales bacterium]